MNEVKRKLAGPVLELFATDWIFLLSQLGIDKLRELNGERGRVVIKLDDAFWPVPRPTVADIERVQVIEVCFHPARIKLRGANLG